MENTPDPKTNSTDGKPATSGSEDNKQGERTFSQEELDRIVQKRVNEVTAKSDEKVKQAVEAALAVHIIADNYMDGKSRLADLRQTALAVHIIVGDCRGARVHVAYIVDRKKV